MRTALCVVALGSFFVAGLAACAVESADDAASESADALRALGAQEIVGSIAYGETKTIAYTDTPLYRALSFTAAAGDEIRIDVAGAAGADARAWLLRSTFGTVASNDDANASTRDSAIVATITKSGTYYVAVREKNREDASFDVKLTKTGPAAAADAGGGSDGSNGQFARGDDHPALPPGPVALTLDGYGRGRNGARGVPIHMKCTLSGTNPGPVDVSCVVNAPYEGLGFSATGKMNGDGASLMYRYDSTSTSGTRYSRRGDVSFRFVARGDTIWATMGASYESTSGFERSGFSTIYPAVMRIQGSAEPTEMQTTEERSCDSVCSDAGLMCIDADAATARWVAFDGCPGLDATPSTMASCQSVFRRRSGFSGEVCDFRLHCKCI